MHFYRGYTNDVVSVGHHGSKKMEYQVHVLEVHCVSSRSLVFITVGDVNKPLYLTWGSFFPLSTCRTCVFERGY